MNDKRASRKGRAIIVATLLVVLFVLAILSDSEHRKQYGTLETIGYSVLGLVGTLVIVGWFAYRWLGIKISRNDGSQSNDSDALAMKETEAEKLLSKATKLETQGRLPEAVNAYEQFITEHPESEMVGDAKTCLNSLKKKIKN